MLARYKAVAGKHTHSNPNTRSVVNFVLLTLHCGVNTAHDDIHPLINTRDQAHAGSFRHHHKDIYK